jgi:drug/metabolite transporter (DMT)-like permease
MVLTALLFIAVDSVAKHLTQRYSIVEVVWARFSFHALFVVILIRGKLRLHLRTRRLGLQLARSFLMLATTALFFAGLRALALVDAVSIMYAGPLMVTALSVPLLGEHVGARRWGAVLVGFCGALVIIRPGTGTMQSAALFPLLAVLAYALYQIATRRLSRHDSSVTTLLYTASVGALVSSICVPFYWVTPTLTDWGWMALLGLLGGAGHFTLIKALSLAPVSTIAPFAYTNLVWSVSIGYLAFAEVPDRWTLFGAGIIIVSALYVFQRERKLKATR